MLANSMDAAEAVRRLGAPPLLNVRVGERTDNRRRKRYTRRILVSTQDLSVSPHAVRTILARDDLLSGEYCRQIADTGRFASSEGGWWRWEIPASRPKKILSEADAEKLARSVFIPALREAIVTAREEATEFARREQATRQASRIARWAGKRVRDRAKGIVRYEQRLAALTAELDAEIAVQSEKLLKDGDIDKAVAKSAEAETKPETFEPEAIEAAKRLLRRFADLSEDNIFRGPVEIKRSEVFPDEADGE